MHTISTISVTFDGDDTATAQSAFAYWGDTATAPAVRSMGRYLDTFRRTRRTDGSWPAARSRSADGPAAIDPPWCPGARPDDRYRRCATAARCSPTPVPTVTAWPCPRTASRSVASAPSISSSTCTRSKSEIAAADADDATADIVLVDRATTPADTRTRSWCRSRRSASTGRGSTGPRPSSRCRRPEDRSASAGLPDQEPLAAGGRIGEWMTGTYAAMAALAALYRVRARRRG